jgi:hypothetical protein
MVIQDGMRRKDLNDPNEPGHRRGMPGAVAASRAGARDRQLAYDDTQPPRTAPMVIQSVPTGEIAELGGSELGGSTGLAGTLALSSASASAVLRLPGSREEWFALRGFSGP